MLIVFVYEEEPVCNTDVDMDYTPAHYVLSQADLLKHVRRCKCKKCQATLDNFNRMKPHQLELIERMGLARDKCDPRVFRAMMEEYSFDELFATFCNLTQDGNVPQPSIN